MGERARLSLLGASIFAFSGVLLIVRPGFDHFNWVMLMPLGSAMGMSMLIIGNRMVAGHASSLAMQFVLAAFASLLLVTTTIVFQTFDIGPAIDGWPKWSVLAKVAVVACSSSFGHWLVYMGTTRAGASLVAPMTYVQLLVAMVMGLIVFGDFPDAISLAGAAMIVAAGLWLWLSGRGRDVAETEAP
ncbi:MAG: DMT family transporter, partial [Novosphingobium sp.]